MGDIYLDLKDSEWVIIDSTPIVDEEDEDSEVGYSSKGKFVWFKLHLSCDECLIPLRAEFTKEFVTGHNPRRLGKDKKRKMDKKFTEMRKRIEQLNSIIKNQIINRFWTNIKGFKKKHVFCMLSVITTQILAIYNLKTYGYPLIRIKDARV